MPTRYCPRGHHWETSPDETPALTCPHCADTERSRPPKPETAHDAGPTRSFPPDSAQSQDTVPEARPAPAAVAVPDYELLDTLGHGGMGVVYLAVQTRLKRIVALKMILSGAHAGPRVRERFRLEADSVARLQHPNIVQIYEVGETEG